MSNDFLKIISHIAWCSKKAFPEHCKCDTMLTHSGLVLYTGEPVYYRISGIYDDTVVT